MITAQTRVSDALLQNPELRKILPAFHPAFDKLNHPVLGKVMPRLVTVGDAARIVGVQVDALVAVMNHPHEKRELPNVVRTNEAEPSWYDGARQVCLDVRPVLSQGLDPLSVILKQLRTLSPGHQLTLLSPFEPVPLIGLLANQGYCSYVRWDGDVCLTTFVLGNRGHEENVGLFQGVVADGMGWRVDVRQLPPPEPMQQVLRAIDDGNLPLMVVHVREPVMLYPKLAERGLRWSVRQLEDRVEVYVERA